MAKKEIKEGIRINKFISESGFCSRRDADQLITDGRVTINGEIATLGSRVAEGDKVKIDGEILQFVPMEMREYKLRRYGSSRRAAQGEEKKEEKAVKRQSHRERQPEERLQVKKPQGESGRGESRRERGEERKRSMSTSRKTEQPRLKSKTGGSTGAKSSARPMQSNRGKSETTVKPFAREKRKK